MNATYWGWVIMGSIVLGNFALLGWIVSGVVLGTLKKLDKLEDRLMCMSEAYPHQAMIALQREARQDQREQAAGYTPSVPSEVPEWQQEHAS